MSRVFTMFVLVVAAAAVSAVMADLPCQPSHTGKGSGCFADFEVCNASNPLAVWDHQDNITSFVLRQYHTDCLNVIGWGTSVGDPVWITPCHPESVEHMENRQWTFQTDGTLINPVSSKCLDGHNGKASTTGAQLELSTCGSSTTQWTYDAKSGLLKSQNNGLCLAIRAVAPPPPSPPPSPPPPPPPPPFAATASVTVGSIIAHSSAGMVSGNFDWHKDDEEPPAWEGQSAMKIDLNNPNLVQAATAIAPGKLRIGGSEGDKIVYDVDGRGCDYWSTQGPVDPAFCLNMTRWGQLAAFCKKTGMRMAFGLNAMTRPSNNKPNNMTNIEAFMKYIAASDTTPYGFEFGNELPKVDADVMAGDYLTLRALINKYWPNASGRPKLIGCDDNPNPSYMQRFLKTAGPALDVVTYHNYVGFGLDPKLADEIPTVKFLDEGYSRAKGVIDAWASEAHQAEIWVGEIAAAWHSGRENVTNAWVSSFWYADALGSMSTHNHTGFCRQCLLGGHYGMLRRDTYLPNPDFYLGMLWHDLMGTKVYNVTVSAQGSASQGTNTLRAYAQCSETMTLALINFDKAARYTVSVSGVPSISPRVEYVLSASNNNPEARHISLNGVPIVMEDGGKLPELKGKTVENQPLVLEPFTITFVKLPNVKC